MIQDIFTVLRKELFDLFAERHSFRGVLLQTVIVVGMAGVFVPSVSHAGPMADTTSVITLYLFFPAMIASTIAADAFAGERERKTLETLFSTPLSDRAIFLGKAATAVMYAGTVCLLSLVASQLTASLRGRPTPLLDSPLLFFGVLLGALGSALVTTSIAILISTRIPITRSVQQLTSMLSIAFVFGTSLMVRRLGWRMDGSAVFRVDILLLALGAAALLVSSAFFSRERFFESR